MATTLTQEPAFSPEVQAAVDRFVGLILSDLRNKRLVLPTLPAVAVQVREAVKDQGSSTTRIARIVSTDTALSARLVQLANSAFYRRMAATDSLPSAITRLGDQVVRTLVTSLLMRPQFETRIPELRSRAEALWLHSAEVAALSAALARRVHTLSVDEAMLAGLVHDIGAMPLLARAEEFPVLLGHPPALEPVIEMLHGAIGKLILETWQFPPAIAEVAAEHEDLGRYSSEVDYVDIVTVANLHSYLGKRHRLAQVAWSDVPAFGKLGLSPDQSLALFEETRAEIAELKMILQG